MTGLPIRILAALFVMLSILAPQSAGLAALTGLADGRVMVICTGDGLRTLRIDAGGNPAATSDTAYFCPLALAVDTATAALPHPVRSQWLYMAPPLLPHPLKVVPPPYRRPLPRAPPVV